MNQKISPSQKIAFLQAGWHKDIVEQSYKAFLKEMKTLGVASKKIKRFDVPGSYEIPLLAKKLAQSGEYAAIIGAGFVIDGGIYRHDFVANAVVNGMMQVQLDTEIPVLSLVLTPHHFHDGSEHNAFFKDHFVLKGKEAARACFQTLENMAKLAA